MAELRACFARVISFPARLINPVRTSSQIKWSNCRAAPISFLPSDISLSRLLLRSPFPATFQANWGIFFGFFNILPFFARLQQAGRERFPSKCSSRASFPRRASVDYSHSLEVANKIRDYHRFLSPSAPAAHSALTIIELCQLFFARHPSASDVYANTLGTAAGALLAAVCPIRISRVVWLVFAQSPNVEGFPTHHLPVRNVAR